MTTGSGDQADQARISLEGQKAGSHPQIIKLVLLQYINSLCPPKITSFLEHHPHIFYWGIAVKIKFLSPDNMSVIRGKGELFI